MPSWPVPPLWKLPLQCQQQPSQVKAAVDTASINVYVRATTALSATGAAIQNGYRSAVNLANRAAVTVDNLTSSGGTINKVRDIVQAATSNRTPPAPNKFGGWPTEFSLSFS
jgi:hypothetical protein